MSASATLVTEAAPPPAHPRRVRGLVRSWMILVPLLASLTATILAMRRTSTTFDEIVLIAGGARGFETGRFDLAPDHPPLMQYLYGLPAYLSHPRYPAESAVRWGSKTRYPYAREFFWGVGNDPERLAFRSRLVGVLLAGLLVLATWLFTLRAYGPGAALIAGTLVAFLPDVLAHGGVAYNDVPMALAYLATLWAVDTAARRPGAMRGALVGVLAALAVGVKYSAVLIAPAALLLVGAEAWRRGRDPVWWRRLAGAVLVSTAVLYLGLVLIFRGDLLLASLRDGIGDQLLHVNAPGGAPNFLLGQYDIRGWWYFFPVAFLFKTSAALHLLIVAGILGLTGAGFRDRPGEPTDAARRSSPSGRSRIPAAHVRQAAGRVLTSPLRVPLLGALVFGAALARSHLDIGFRYALPVLPLVCILTAVGVERFWRRVQRPMFRSALGLLLAWYVAAPLTVYPWFLSYVSEYGPGREASYEVLSDSSTDWGQGLLALRDFMTRNRIPLVYLSYFGSARPDGYGIRYVPLASFFPLLPTRAPTVRPEWVVVSATNLEPIYLRGDPFAVFRRARPDRVLGGSLFAYRLHE